MEEPFTGDAALRRWQIYEEYHLMEFVLEWGLLLKAIENYLFARWQRFFL
jgi:hypothetical protein